MKFGLPDAVCSVGTITWVVRHQWARLDIAQLDHYIYNFNHTTANTYSFMQAYLVMQSQWNSIFKYLTITTSVLPGNCNCKATSQTDADLKAVNGRVKHCVRDTSSNGEPAPKCGKYTYIYIYIYIYIYTYILYIYIMPTLQNRVHRLVNMLKRTGLLGIFATTAHRVIPSHGCATVQVVTLCKKCGN